MTFLELQTISQNMFKDVNIFITTSELKAVLNEAENLVCLLTFCYEKYKDSADWGGVISAYQNIFPMPSDCIAPIYVYDSNNGARIHACKLSQLELLGSTWEVATGANYQNYCLFDPSYYAPSTNNVETGCKRNYTMLVYPKVNTTSMQINMLYAAGPPAMTNDNDVPKVPIGHESCLFDYALLYGWTKRKGKKSLIKGLEVLKVFFGKVGMINDLMKSKYPQGRDFEPVPTELLLERFNLNFQIGRKQE